jgi:hypothetical protein
MAFILLKYRVKSGLSGVEESQYFVVDSCKTLWLIVLINFDSVLFCGVSDIAIADM